MYRKQMTLQKLLCFAAIAASAIMFLYALGLMTDLYDSLYYTMMDPNNPKDTWVTGSWIYYDMQPFNRTLLSVSIMMILLSCLLFITGTHKRRRYYAGNALSTFAFVAAGAVSSVWCHQQVTLYREQFLQVNFDELDFFADLMKTSYTTSTFWFDVHYAVLALIAIVCAALIANFIWKHSLMRAEKKLIDAGREAAK